MLILVKGVKGIYITFSNSLKLTYLIFFLIAKFNIHVVVMNDIMEKYITTTSVPNIKREAFVKATVLYIYANASLYIPKNYLLLRESLKCQGLTGGGG